MNSHDHDLCWVSPLPRDYGEYESKVGSTASGTSKNNETEGIEQKYKKKSIAAIDGRTQVFLPLHVVFRQARTRQHECFQMGVDSK